MSSHKLMLDRIEYLKVAVEANEGKFKLNDTFPQIEFNYDDAKIMHRSDLRYDPKCVSDPRQFYLVLGTKVVASDDSRPLPYNIEVLLAGYFRYAGDEFSGADRFRAVRFSGYQILYGATREIVANMTARGPHGLFHIPAKNFGLMAKTHAEKDEVMRDKLMSNALSDNLSTPSNDDAKLNQINHQEGAHKTLKRVRTKKMEHKE